MHNTDHAAGAVVEGGVVGHHAVDLVLAVRTKQTAEVATSLLLLFPENQTWSVQICIAPNLPSQEINTTIVFDTCFLFAT